MSHFDPIVRWANRPPSYPAAFVSLLLGDECLAYAMPRAATKERGEHPTGHFHAVCVRAPPVGHDGEVAESQKMGRGSPSQGRLLDIFDLLLHAFSIGGVVDDQQGAGIGPMGVPCGAWRCLHVEYRARSGASASWVTKTRPSGWQFRAGWHRRSCAGLLSWAVVIPAPLGLAMSRSTCSSR